MIALICARKNSKGVKKKNFQKIGKYSLLQITAQHAIKLKKKKILSDIFISTDSSVLADQAKKMGLKVPFIRPKKLSGDRVPELEVWKHFLNNTKFQNKENDLMVLSCTSPLRQISDIEKGVKKFKRNKMLNGMVAITETNHNPYFNMVSKITNSNLIQKAIKTKIYRRQDVPKIYNITTALYLGKIKYILNTKDFYKGKIGYIEILKETAIDIDDNFDLKLCRILKNE